MSRAIMARWIQIITGHNQLGYHQNKIDSQIDPSCRLCEEANETFIHLLTDCPALELERIELFPNGIADDNKWSIKRILKFSQLPKVDILLTSDEYIYKEIIDIDHLYSSDSNSQ